MRGKCESQQIADAIKKPGNGFIPLLQALKNQFEIDFVMVTTKLWYTYFFNV